MVQMALKGAKCACFWEGIRIGCRIDVEVVELGDERFDFARGRVEFGLMRQKLSISSCVKLTVGGVSKSWCRLTWCVREKSWEGRGNGFGEMCGGI